MFKTLVGRRAKAVTSAASSPDAPDASSPASAEIYAEWCAAHPDAAAAFAVEWPRGRHRRCPVHDAPLMTAMGWRSPMDALPSHGFMEAAGDHPFCLDVGERLAPLARDRPQRLVYCAACVAGMRALGFNR